jgi:hypothetical protein
LVFKPVRDACKTWMIAPNVIVGQGLMAHYFFISHSSKHKPLADAARATPDDAVIRRRIARVTSGRTPVDFGGPASAPKRWLPRIGTPPL